MPATVASTREIVVGDDFPFRALNVHGANDPDTPWGDATLTWALRDARDDRVVSEGGMTKVADTDADFEAVVPRADLGPYAVEDEDPYAVSGLELGREYALLVAIVKDGVQTTVPKTLKAVKRRTGT